MSANNNKEMIEGTLGKQFKLVYDINALPGGLDPQSMVKLADTGFIFYDSTKGNRPKLFHTGELDTTIEPVFVDVKGEEVKLELIQKQWDDNEFWRKELYKCKQSPLYYFTNYKSISPKPTQQEVNDFLVSIGMGATSDSEEVTKEEITKVREEFSKTITLEHLKDLKPVRDSIDAEYEQETSEIQKEIADKYGFTETNVLAIKPKVITDIMKSQPKDCHVDLKYYIALKSGRWDKALLQATDIDVLVRLWKLL